MIIFRFYIKYFFKLAVKNIYFIAFFMQFPIFQYYIFPTCEYSIISFSHIFWKRLSNIWFLRIYIIRTKCIIFNKNYFSTCCKINYFRCSLKIIHFFYYFFSSSVTFINFSILCRNKKYTRNKKLIFFLYIPDYFTIFYFSRDFLFYFSFF